MNAVYCYSCEDWRTEVCPVKDHRSVPERSDVAILNALLVITKLLAEIRNGE